MSEKYLVIGAGISGVSACELLLNNNENVTLYDGNANLDKEKIVKDNPFMERVSFIVGDVDFSFVKDFTT